ncbi:putative nucleic acid-binding protein, contains PIN domain [Geoglobus ahangari]|uniref:Ribonuclease VapC n=1 Tax=Geoglobus ahangari TaxID=113653 RepID=A0A0F7IH49_9EURY|nr:type II toxin-antitoxin system VapC family toxin [Geoglobus ahangari]AKG92223.1 putative nucleic acid-binding protein, contains PIN domain [Geoglobus ahangari]
MICLDTNILVDILREDVSSSDIESKIEGEEICITSISLFEIWHGIFLSGKRKKEIKVIEALEKSVEVLSFDSKAARLSAEIYTESKKKGFEIPPLDALIAGTAKRHGARLLTRDKHFTKIEGLEVVIL